MSKKLVLIDGHSILNRAFYGLPILTNSEGIPTNAILGFFNILFRILEEEKPEYLAIAFDLKAPTFRHKLYPEYKGTRKSMPEELAPQIPICKDIVRAMNILVLEKEGYEADDLLGTFAYMAQEEGLQVSLVSGDRDLLQIATDMIKIRIPKTKSGKTIVVDYYDKDVLEEYQLDPKTFIQYKALVGDTSDNIPGVPRIGDKTATKLLVEYGSIDSIYDNIDNISQSAIKKSLLDNRHLAQLSLELATIDINCIVGHTLDEATLGDIYTKEAYDYFRELEFKELITRFDTDMINHRIEADYKIIEYKSELDVISNLLKATVRMSIYPIYNESDNSILLMALDINKEIYVISHSGDISIEDINNLLLSISNSFTDENVHSNTNELSNISTYDIKPLNCVLYNTPIDILDDLMLIQYLINPNNSNFDLVDIGIQYLGETHKRYKEIFNKMQPSQAYILMKEELYAHAANMVRIIYETKPIISDRLIEEGMWDLYRSTELPLTRVLYDMENTGIRVDKARLKAYGQSLEGRILELEQLIYDEAGEEFNLNSTKQLGEILFDKLLLPHSKKTKTGYSTAADVLEKLAPEYTIVKNILEYRGLYKLKTTYADGLDNYIGEDERIHTSFNQTVTATGRLSSTEPNLQNIPTRTILGRKIRKVFIPGEGRIFVDGDYSQIELRILAHMSQDEQLIEAYNSDMDIHRITAAKVFKTPIEEVTDTQRSNAKAVNFGIVYGISSFGLSQDLSITGKEAARYISQYFDTYPKVKLFLDELVELAKTKGVATTEFGRKRPIPELMSSNYMQRSFGERVAMNAPIQGSAADIMKIAMIDVWRHLKEKNMKSKLILQIHDELLIEAYEEELGDVLEILRSSMQNAVELRVKLVADINYGKDWYEAK